MATKEDQPPNSGLWGQVEVEALPNPGSLPPPPLDNTPIHRGTLMGFAVPPPANVTQPGPLRRTPNSGTTPLRVGSKTLTSGVAPPFLPNDLDRTAVPQTTPIGTSLKDTVVGPGGEPQARNYYRASQAGRTLIGGSVPVTHNAPQSGQPTRRGTAPGFSTLPEPTLDKSTLIGVTMPRNLASSRQTDEPPAHPTYRSAPVEAQPATERNGGDFTPTNRSPHQEASPNASHLGRFRIQKRLGAGGVGAVYLASKVDNALGGQQLLAVKVLREHFYRDPSTLKALFREARLAARMDHRHIVRVFDIGYHNKQPYLVMEYVDGLSLAAMFNHSEKLPLAVGIRCLIDTLHGLDFAHKLRGDEGEPLGLVHCDVSPPNILVGVDGITKVTDFGVARTREEDGDEFVLRCKPEYSAPELLRGEPVRPETDVFSAGAVLYRIATGRAAFTGNTEEEIVEDLLNGELTPPSQVREGLPPFLDAFCAQAMAKGVNDRFRTCLDMARALERQAEAAGLLADRVTVGAWVLNARRALELGDSAPPPPRKSESPTPSEAAGPPTTLRERRTSKRVGLVALALLVVAALGGYWWWQRQATTVTPQVDVIGAPSVASIVAAAPAPPLPSPNPIATDIVTTAASPSAMAPAGAATTPTASEAAQPPVVTAGPLPRPAPGGSGLTPPPVGVGRPSGLGRLTSERASLVGRGSTPATTPSTGTGAPSPGGATSASSAQAVGSAPDAMPSASTQNPRGF